MIITLNQIPGNQVNTDLSKEALFVRTIQRSRVLEAI